MTHPAVANGSYDVLRVREDFPALAMQVYGKPLVYFDNAASAQKPNAVLDRMTQAYRSEYANVHRGLHYLANAATEAYEGGRARAASFLNARRNEEIIFTRNATEALNLVASSWGEPNIKAGDEIVLSIMEHHSNIVPWNFLRERHGAVIKWAPVEDEGNFLIDEFEKLLTPKTKLVAITQMSNALGTIVPVKDVVKIAHARGIPVLVDGFVATSAAAIAHAVNPRAIDHCLFAHVSAESAHVRALAHLGARPLLDLGMRLGEGSGAALGIVLAQTALHLHTHMATFASAGVSNKD